METLKTLLQTIQGRQVDAPENSYTAYLFREGLDKILKKVGEESAEVIIAAKNSDSDELVNELADLQYHLLVLMAEKNISWDVLDAELARRSQKIGNKKVFHQVDKES